MVDVERGKTNGIIGYMSAVANRDVSAIVIAVSAEPLGKINCFITLIAA